jgi:hypothetical protein
MWNSAGRSGHHQQYVGNGPDDWSGVSPNGRQYQNEATQERRDLSGADYWHLRKQNRPTEEIPAELHFKNSRIKGLQMANIGAYAEKPEAKKKPAKTVSIRDRICPQGKTYERLEKMQKDLEQEFLDGKLSDEDYLSLSAVLDKKLQRAWALLCKAMQWKEDDASVALYCDDFYPEFDVNEFVAEEKQQTNQPVQSSQKAQSVQQTPSKWMSNRVNVSVFEGLDERNVFRQAWVALRGLRAYFRAVAQ